MLFEYLFYFIDNVKLCLIYSLIAWSDNNIFFQVQIYLINYLFVYIGTETKINELEK